MNRTYAYLRNDRKIKFRMVSAQHFINEAPDLWTVAVMTVFLQSSVLRHISCQGPSLPVAQPGERL